jgi:hypothetical protein
MTAFYVGEEVEIVSTGVAGTIAEVTKTLPGLNRSVLNLHQLILIHHSVSLPQ